MSESACLRHTDIPHTSKLFLDFQYHFDRVARFYNGQPNDPSTFARAASEVRYPDQRRAELVAALRARNGDRPALDLLARPGTVAVVTGQQVGLFTGPAYTIYKALTAAHLASRLNGRGIPAVPVFWLPTEDHDFAEVNHTFVFGPEQRPVLLKVDVSDTADRPAGAIALDCPPLKQLEQALDGLPFAPQITAMVRSAYHSGATLGSAFQALLEDLLGKYGFLFVDPLDPAIRRLASPVLREAVRTDHRLHQNLVNRNRELEQAGYHAQVHIEAKTSLVFLLEGNHRIALRRQNGQFVSRDRRYSVEELAERSEQLSPNALLRPVMQDYVLPTVAYVGGPAELAYMAQSQVLYQELLGRMPLMLARSAFTILDARANKLMKRYGLTLPAVFHGEDAVRETVAKHLIPVPIAQEFTDLQRSTAESLQRLRNDLAAFDRTLASAADKSRAKILYQLSKIERKTARETLSRNERAAAESSYTSNLIYPEKHLQERFYSILPFLARHGLGLMDTLYENIHPECPDHKVLVV